jgi:hypothetical protein
MMAQDSEITLWFMCTAKSSTENNCRRLKEQYMQRRGERKKAPRKLSTWRKANKLQKYRCYP